MNHLVRFCVLRFRTRRRLRRRDRRARHLTEHVTVSFLSTGTPRRIPNTPARPGRDDGPRCTRRPPPGDAPATEPSNRDAPCATPGCIRRSNRDTRKQPIARVRIRAKRLAGKHPLAPRAPSLIRRIHVAPIGNVTPSRAVGTVLREKPQRGSRPSAAENDPGEPGEGPSSFPVRSRSHAGRDMAASTRSWPRSRGRVVARVAGVRKDDQLLWVDVGSLRARAPAVNISGATDLWLGELARGGPLRPNHRHVSAASQQAR